MSEWKTLGDVSPGALVDARLELHHAAQLLAIGVGRSLVPRRDDDSHTSLGWLAEEERWVGEEVPGSGGVKAGLRPADLTLVLTRDSDGALRERPLAGKTLDEGVAALKEELAELGVDPSRVSMEAHYEIPDHPVASGGAWSAGLRPHFAELGRYFGNAFRLLREVAESPRASPIRTWPHHFDMATLLTLEGAGTRTIGVGLSPGDEHYAEPYFYVSPWPYPEEAVDLPALESGGHWHVEGFTAAVLIASRLLAGGEQEECARRFLASAVAGSRVVLARG